MKLNNSSLVLIGTIVIVVFGIGVLIFKGMGSLKQGTPLVEPTEVVMPTLDSSVQVDLSSNSGGKEVTLAIEGIPSNTQSIDYELSYQTKQQGLQGVIGTIPLKGESNYEKKLTLGTCSSGSCVYHQVLGKIKLTLKFTGDYGDKIFEKEFEI